MPFTRYDPDTAAMLFRAFDQPSLELGVSNAQDAEWRRATTTRLTAQLLAATEAGERDPERLRLLATTRGLDRP